MGVTRQRRSPSPAPRQCIVCRRRTPPPGAAPALLPTSVRARTSTADATWQDWTPASGLPRGNKVKYSGALIADMDGDGWYDLVLNNHDQTRLQVYWNNRRGRFLRGQDALPYRMDAHGMAAGDLGGAPGADWVVMQGGSNGATPAPPRLLRTRGPARRLVQAQRRAGVAGPASAGRGRTPLLADLDGDGDLDLVLLNYDLAAGDRGPRQKVYENIGGGVFRQRRRTGLEDLTVERAIVTDLNGDGRLDIVAFPYLRLLLATGPFAFTDVTLRWLWGMPNWSALRYGVRAVAEVDTANAGVADLYLCRHPRQDVLLRNRGTRLAASPAGAVPAGTASGDVTVGDFNNDGRLDLFLSHPAGTANGRPGWRPDTLLTAIGDGRFRASTSHGATQWTVAPGDSVQAFDYDRDGRLDLLVGGGDEVTAWRGFSGVPGPWSLFTSTIPRAGAGGATTGSYSPSAARRRARAPRGGRRSASARGGGAQADVPPPPRGGGGGGGTTDELRLVHFGLGGRDYVDQVRVRWSNGEVRWLSPPPVDKVTTVTK
ncbi:hypothetical protein BU14_0810s0002 [Porphyra umbilicalis]|uniref:ASPIC/UnbV domain-containing protein n=1 Tax=Porphyra umbilicalis TaxID=2786 RepID=A0A1X6NNV2_PORUM|nr:hypothetical protein BU14_0810s0002 [Porphyra umbilicalis]|eukprot:OSX70291.1 hypothetical protein BU14_0810s0002 [Porphyra umbilicalis]